MTRITWNDPGDRLYEFGIDRGVLYTKSGKIAPWNGLRGVDEKPVGSEVSTFYLDGEKFNQMVDSEEYSATLSAFTYPDEFMECDGTVALSKGLHVTAQDRTLFDLSYRTMIGNDTDGPDHGYRIHLVYNALASPTNRTNKTTEDRPEPIDLAWDITSMPIRMPGQRASAHYYIDSTKMNKYILAQIEDILYGTPFAPPRMLSAAELVKFFKNATVVTITDNKDGSWTAEGPDDIIQFISWDEFIISWDSAVFIDETSYTLKSE